MEAAVLPANAPPSGAVADESVPTYPGGYRAHLDGLRTVAVYLVVAFHAGADRLAGGFVGVDVFFVLSGYLVTLLLLRDLRSDAHIWFGRFYSRRVRRLLPASFVTLLVAGAAYTAVASPLDVAEALRSIQAAFLYLANWFFIRESSDYFAADVESSPVLHFWSLAIEEQFYLLWPLALGGLYVATRRLGLNQWRAIRTVVVVVGIVSLVMALRLAGTDLSRAYYGTDTRAYQLLAGAFIALSPGIVSRLAPHRQAARTIVVVGLAALVVMSTSFVELNPIRRGVVATTLTVLLLVALEASAGGLGQRSLSIAPLTYLGRISYGTYLWHWPVIILIKQVMEISPVSLFFLASLTATGIASLSFQVLETPVRNNKVLDRYRRSVVAGGLALSVIGALVLAPAVVQGGTSRPIRSGGPPVEGGTPVPAGIDFVAVLEDRAGPPSCVTRESEFCVSTPGEGQKVMLLGDSHAGMLFPAFTDLAERRGDELSVAIQNTCPWQRDLSFGLERGPCLDSKRAWDERVIPDIGPDVIVIAGRTLDDPSNTVSITDPLGSVRRGDDGYEERLRDATTQTIEGFRATGAKVVIIEPTPYMAEEDDPLRCLSGAEFVEQCAYTASPGPSPSERIYRAIAAGDDGVWTLDLDSMVCPRLPTCDPIIDGVIVKFDEGHLTPPFATTLSPQIEAFLVDNGVLDG